MLILKAAALAVIACILALTLKKDQPGFAFLISLCAALTLLGLASQQLQPVLSQLQDLAARTDVASFSLLLRVLAIALITQLGTGICQEAGLSAAASCLEFCGRVLAMLQALPLLQSLVASFLSFLP